MTAFNTLRDRLLLRLLSQPSREALNTVVFYDIESEIKDFRCTFPENRSTGHVAVGLTHLADLIDDTADLTAQLTNDNNNNN
jgi:hypothetical protein